MTAFGVLAGTATILFLGAIATRMLSRHRRITRYDILLAVFALGGAVDLASTFELGLITPVTSHTLMIMSSLAGLLVAVEMLRLVANGDQQLPHLWRWRLFTAALVIALSLVAIIGQPLGPLGVPNWESSNLLAIYWAGYGLFQLVACVLMLVIIARVRAGLPTGPLRQVTGLLAAALLIGLYYATSLIILAAEANQWVPTNGLGTLGYQLGTISYVFIALAYVRIRIARIGSRRSDIRFLTTVTPLWKILAPVAPAFTLIGVPHDPATLSRNQLSLHSVRTAIEIRDWMDILACRLSNTAYATALTSARATLPDHADQQTIIATATAGWIRAGLLRPLCTDEELATAISAAPDSGLDVDTEFDLLAAVAAVPDHLASSIAERVQRESVTATT